MTAKCGRERLFALDFSISTAQLQIPTSASISGFTDIHGMYFTNYIPVLSKLECQFITCVCLNPLRFLVPLLTAPTEFTPR